MRKVKSLIRHKRLLLKFVKMKRKRNRILVVLGTAAVKESMVKKETIMMMKKQRKMKNTMKTKKNLNLSSLIKWLF